MKKGIVLALAVTPLVAIADPDPAVMTLTREADITSG
jgi:hypothetical protein